MINRRKRRDGNHSELLGVFARLGWTCLDTSQCGGGAPDAICARGGRTVAIEIKTLKGKVKPHQQSWLAAWPGETAIVRSVADVITLTATR